MPRPLSRFVAIALFYYRQCQRQSPCILMTVTEVKGLIILSFYNYFFLPLNKDITFLAPEKRDIPNIM